MCDWLIGIQICTVTMNKMMMTDIHVQCTCTSVIYYTQYNYNYSTCTFTHVLYKY